MSQLQQALPVKQGIREPSLKVNEMTLGVRSRDSMPKPSKPPKVSAWTKPLPLTLQSKLTEAGDQDATPPTSATSCILPMSAFTFNTDSTPGSPLVTPAVQEPSNALLEYQKTGAPFAHPPNYPYDSYQNGYGYQPLAYLMPESTYPWGMPMSPLPLPGYAIDPAISNIPGGPGVLWTPSGWAVQDAAMKQALRAAEIKTKGSDVKQRKPKAYYKSESSFFHF